MKISQQNFRHAIDFVEREAVRVAEELDKLNVADDLKSRTSDPCNDPPS